jgi:hypothetical protein
MVVEMDRECITHGGEDETMQILVWKPEQTKSLGRPKYSWEGNIKTNCKEIGCGIHLAQHRVQWWAVVNMVMNFRFHKRWGIS